MRLFAVSHKMILLYCAPQAKMVCLALKRSTQKEPITKGNTQSTVLSTAQAAHSLVSCTVMSKIVINLQKT